MNGWMWIFHELTWLQRRLSLLVEDKAEEFSLSKREATFDSPCLQISSHPTAYPHVVVSSSEVAACVLVWHRHLCKPADRIISSVINWTYAAINKNLIKYDYYFHCYHKNLINETGNEFDDALSESLARVIIRGGKGAFAINRICVANGITFTSSNIILICSRDSVVSSRRSQVRGNSETRNKIDILHLNEQTSW